MEENKFFKYKRIPHLDEVLHILDKPVQVYEKIDGGNAQVRKINGRVICGSRAHFLTREKFFRQEWFKDFQRWTLRNYTFYNLLEDLIVYGEWSSKHVLDYKSEFTNKFFMTDVLDLNYKRFIPYEEAKEILFDLKIENLLYLTPLSKGKTNFEQLVKMLEKSEYSNGDREGLVIKNYDSQEFAKLWTSSIKRKGIITVSDIENIILGFKDSGKEIEKEKVIKGLEKDFRRSNRGVSHSAIEKKVDEYFENFSDN